MSVLYSCNEDEFLKEEIKDEILLDNLYLDATGFDAGLNAIYELIQVERGNVNNIYSGGEGSPFTLFSGVSDVSYVNHGDGSDLLGPMFDWGEFVNSDWLLNQNVFKWLYRIINASNTIINRAENPDVKWTEAEKNRVLAEARTMRAWAYRHASYTWGDIPYTSVESNGATIKTDWERTPKEDIWRKMVEDLLFAEQYLPDLNTHPGKLSKAVAQHYLAETYLALGEDTKAESVAKAVCEGADYELITSRYGVESGLTGVPFMDQFKDGNAKRSQGNTEALWTFLSERYMPGGERGFYMRKFLVNRYYQVGWWNKYRPRYNGGRGIGRISPTGYAISLYEDDDDRFSSSALRKYLKRSSDPDGTKYWSIRWEGDEKVHDKYWVSTRKWDWVDPEFTETTDSGASTVSFGDMPYLRVAETYLLYAEALMKNDKTDEAAIWINKLRTRSNASEIVGADVTLDFILEERSRELLTEEHRRHTLVRLGKWYEKTSTHNKAVGNLIKPYNALFPIPQSVIDANLNKVMLQNEGYN